MSDTTLKNPCLECDHHLSGGDKNVCECTDCEKRIAYVNAIGTSPGETVNEGVYMDGDGGGSDAEKILKTLSTVKQKANQNQTKPDSPEKPGDLKSEKSINNHQSSIDNLIEDHIKSICQGAGITIEQIRTNAKNIYDKKALQLFHDTRDRIIKSLASGGFGRLSQTKIAKYLGISNHVVSVRMKIMGIAPMYLSGAHTISKWKKLAEKKKPKTPDPAKPKKDKKTPDRTHLVLRLDFTDLPEIYDDLQALAVQELRTIDNQALYIFKQIHTRGLNFKEL